MIYILMLLSALNGSISMGVAMLLHHKPDEINYVSIWIAALFFVNAWFFGVAAYLV